MRHSRIEWTVPDPWYVRLEEWLATRYCDVFGHLKDPIRKMDLGPGQALCRRCRRGVDV